MIKTQFTAIYRSLGADCAVVRATTSDPPHGPEVGGERAIDRGLRWGVAALRVGALRGAMPHEMSLYHRDLV